MFVFQLILHIEADTEWLQFWNGETGSSVSASLSTLFPALLPFFKRILEAVLCEGVQHRLQSAPIT
jgi:hypothetical protein